MEFQGHGQGGGGIMHFGYSEAKAGLNVEAVCGMGWFSCVRSMISEGKMEGL